MRAAVLPGRVLAAGRPVRDGRRHRCRRPRPARRNRGPTLPGPRLLPRRGRLRLHLAGRRPRPRAAARARRAPRGPAGRRGGRTVQPGRRPGARHLPGRRHPRAGLPRPPRPAHRGLRHRRLQRPLGAPADPRRLLVRRRRLRTPRAGRAVRRRGTAVVPGPRPAGRHLVDRARHPARTPRARPDRAARQRDRGLGAGRRRRPLPLGGLRRVLHVRGTGRGVARAGLPPGRPRLLRPHPLRRLSRDDRHLWPRLGRRGHRGRRLRHRAAPADDPLRRPTAPGGRPGTTDGGVGPTEAARYLYGAAIVLVLLYAPDGLHGLARRARARIRARPWPAARTRSPKSSPTDPTSATAARAKEPTP